MEIKRKRSPKKIVISIVVVVILLIAGVLGAAWFQLRGISKQNALTVADDVLRREESLKGILDKKWDSLEDFSEADKYNMTMLSWPKTAWMPQSYMGVKIVPDEISQKLDHINTVYDKLNQIRGFSYIANAAAAIKEGKSAKEQYEKLSKSGDTEFARELGQEMLDYLKKVDEFKEKYTDKSDIDELKMQEDYGVVQNLGVELTKKYENVGFEDLFGISREEIDSIFEDARALKAWAEQ